MQSLPATTDPHPLLSDPANNADAWPVGIASQSHRRARIRRARRTSWLGLTVAALAPALALTGAGKPADMVGTFAFALLGVGPAITCWLDSGDVAAQAALTVGLSLAAFACTATVLIWAAYWHPKLIFLLAVPAGGACALRLMTAGRIGAGPES